MDPVTSGGYTYADSASSSPRSRSADSYDDAFPSNNSNSNSKVRLMCSYGGRIVPRPTDKSLTYLGGDTRFLLLDRHSSLSDLLSKLTRTIFTNSNSDSFVIKYQLPNEDLDSLITLSSDEDLENMVDEYDRINNSSSSAARSSRIRLFLFPTGKTAAADTSSSIGSLLDDSKSETWFVDALNGALGTAADSAGSADLLGLEVGGGDRMDADRGMTRPDSYGKLETNSSFGSGSSGPVLPNLPPIRVRAEERPPERRYENNNDNLDDRFQKMNLSSGAKNPTPVVTAATNPAVSAVENLNPNPHLNRVVGSNDERPDARKQQQAMLQQTVHQQQKPPLVEAPISDSRPVYYQERIPPVQTNPEPKREIPASDQATNYRIQQVPIPGMQQQVPIPGMQRQVPIPGMQQQVPVTGMQQQVPVPGMQQVPGSGIQQQVPVSGMQQVSGSGIQQQVPGSGMQQVPLSGMQQQVPVSGMQQVPVSGMQQQVPVSGMQQVPGSGMQQVPVSGMQQQVPVSGMQQQVPVSGMQQVPVSGMQQQVPVSGMQQQVPVSGMQQVPGSGMQQQVPRSGMQQQVPVGMQQPGSAMQQVHLAGMQQVPVSGMQQVSIPESSYVMPTAPQQPAQPQQQQQQQFVHTNTQYVPVQSYYQVSHPVQQSQPYDPSIPMYYVPVRPNPQPVSAIPLPKVTSNPESQPNLYRPVAPQPQMIHMAAPGAEQGYHVMHHHHPSQTPAQPMANYVYYTQTTTMTPSMPTQYQTVISDAVQPTVEMNQNRAS